MKEDDVMPELPKIGPPKPCFKCGKQITETIPCGGVGMDINGVIGEWEIPHGGTQFTTNGHYGSTFWDSFDGEYITIVICDDCCRTHMNLMRFKKHLDYGKTKEFIPDR